MAGSTSQTGPIRSCIPVDATSDALRLPPGTNRPVLLFTTNGEAWAGVVFFLEAVSLCTVISTCQRLNIKCPVPRLVWRNP